MRRLFTIILVVFFFSRISAQQLSNSNSESQLCNNAIENTIEPGDIRGYPNPVSDKLYFTGSDRLTGDMVKIYSLLGNEVLSSELSGQESINIAGLKDAMYLYCILDKNDKTILNGKFNKE